MSAKIKFLNIKDLNSKCIKIMDIKNSKLMNVKSTKYMDAKNIESKLKARLDNEKLRKLIFNVVLIAVFLSVLVFVGIKYGTSITELAEDPDRLSKKLNYLGWKGVFAFIGLQMLQVIIAVIPGGLVQIAGGYIYGPGLGLLYSIIGILLGSVMVFYTARILGFPLVKLLVSPENLRKFDFMINSDKSEIAMFVLFLIPGMPKDVMTYMAGITPVKPVKFFVISIVGRLPALFGSALLGHSTQKGNYTAAVLLIASSIILFIIGLLIKDKVICRLRNLAGKAGKGEKAASYGKINPEVEIEQTGLCGTNDPSNDT